MIFYEKLCTFAIVEYFDLCLLKSLLQAICWTNAPRKPGCKCSKAKIEQIQQELDSGGFGQNVRRPAGEITKLLSVQISIETTWNDDGC